MSLIDLDALQRTPLSPEPYDHLITPAFVPGGALAEVLRDFPRIDAAGSYPPSELEMKGAFARLLEEMDGPGFRAVIEDKFGLDLSGRPTMFTVRGRCRKSNGSVHTDTESKIISVLLYLNESWEAGGGRLRVLNSPDLDDVAAEVPPWGGALLVFRRGEALLARPRTVRGRAPGGADELGDRRGGGAPRAGPASADRPHQAAALRKPGRRRLLGPGEPPLPEDERPRQRLRRGRGALGALRAHRRRGARHHRAACAGSAATS